MTQHTQIHSSMLPSPLLSVRCHRLLLSLSVGILMLLGASCTKTVTIRVPVVIPCQCPMVPKTPSLMSPLDQGDKFLLDEHRRDHRKHERKVKKLNEVTP